MAARNRQRCGGGRVVGGQEAHKSERRLRRRGARDVRVQYGRL